MADLLEEQRRLMFEALAKQMGFYDSSQSQGLMSGIMRQVSGQDQPFTPEVVQNMLAQNADASAGGYRANQSLINRAMANAGLTGSGLEASALLSAQMRQNQAARVGRREVNTRAQLENYNARERAQTTAMNYLAQQEQAKRSVTAMEVGERGKMYAGGDAANVAAVTGGQPAQQPGVAPQPAQPALSAPLPARPQKYGLSNNTILMPGQDPNRWGGVVGGFGGAGGTMAGMGGLANANAQYQQQLQQQQSDRAYLSQLQADWDARYGGK